MLQRTILRTSRQQAARSIRPFAPLRQQSPITRAVATPAIRWYSDAAPAKEGEAAEKKEDAPAENNEATQLKEQLEKKDKEIVDLKVCFNADCMHKDSRLTSTARTNISAQSPTSATSKNVPNARSRPQKTSPSSASPAIS
jgi:hypothetical protein